MVFWGWGLLNTETIPLKNREAVISSSQSKGAGRGGVWQQRGDMGVGTGQGN